MLYEPARLRNTGFQNLPRPRLVPRHFGDQCGKGIELELIPDAFDELDLHLPTVEVAVEIQEMNLEQGGPSSTVGRVPKLATAGKARPSTRRYDGINPVGQPVGRLERNIGRRHAKRAPQALAPKSPGPKRVVAAETCGRDGEVATLEGLANRARGDSASLVLNLRDNLHAKTVSFARLGERGRRTGSPLAEMEVPPDHDRGRSKSRDQNFRDEVLPRPFERARRRNR